MRPLAILSLVASLCFAATNAQAASGIAMRWDRCFGEGGESNKNFACNTNAGSEKLVISYVPSAPFPDWSGVEIIVDAMSGTTGFPSWWQMRNVGTCRQVALAANVTSDPNATHCIDNYQAYGAGGVATYQTSFPAPNRARLAMAFAVPPENIVTLNSGVEYFACNVVIGHTKTVGTGACSGCAEPFCLIVGSINLVSQSASLRLVEPLAPNSAVVGWQGASPTLYYQPPSGPPRYYPGEWSITTCASATPTLTPTWGMIKSLYR